MAVDQRIILKRYCEESYWRDPQVEWLPRRAEFDLSIDAAEGEPGLWREVKFSIGCGSAELYRYFPFSCFLYVEDQLQAVVEMSGPFGNEQALLRIPCGRTVRITFISELGEIPAKIGLAQDFRELAVLLLDVGLGEPVPPPPPRMPHLLPAAHDYFSQHAVKLVDDLPRPIFVTGAYRSGTSILTWALGQHPDLLPVEETGWLPLLAGGALSGFRVATRAARNFFDTYDVAQQEYLAHLGHSVDNFMRRTSHRHAHHINLQRLSGHDRDFHQQFQIVRTAFNPKQRWIDGTPENTGSIGLLQGIFPAARFVFLVRRPEDVIASLMNFERAGGVQQSLDQAAATWISMTRAGILAARALGSVAVRTILYEQLVDNPRTTLRDLFDFLDEPQFDLSERTFSQRINSSTVEQVERDTVIANLGRATDLSAELSALYRAARELATAPAAPDHAAMIELAEMQNDRIERLVAAATL